MIGRLIYVLTWSLFTNPHSCPTLSKSEGSSPEGIPAPAPSRDKPCRQGAEVASDTEHDEASTVALMACFLFLFFKRKILNFILIFSASVPYLLVCLCEGVGAP